MLNQFTNDLLICLKINIFCILLIGIVVMKVLIANIYYLWNPDIYFVGFSAHNTTRQTWLSPDRRRPLARFPTRITPRRILESSFSFWNENRFPSLPSSFCAAGFLLASSFFAVSVEFEFVELAGVVAVADAAAVVAAGAAVAATMTIYNLHFLTTLIIITNS